MKGNELEIWIASLTTLSQYRVSVVSVEVSLYFSSINQVVLGCVNGESMAFSHVNIDQYCTTSCSNGSHSKQHGQTKVLKGIRHQSHYSNISKHCLTRCSHHSTASKHRQTRCSQHSNISQHRLTRCSHQSNVTQYRLTRSSHHSNASKHRQTKCSHYSNFSQYPQTRCTHHSYISKHRQTRCTPNHLATNEISDKNYIS